MKAHLSSEVQQSALKVISEISSSPSQVLSQLDGKIEKNTRLQTALKTKHSSILERTLHEIVLNHAISSEKMGAGSLDAFINMMNQPEAPEVVSEIIHGRHATIDDVFSLVERHTKNVRPVINAMVREALCLAGFHGRIIIEKTKAKTPSVELVCGYNFALTPCFLNDFSFTHVRLACIDGYIESVSEVHHLLEAASSANEPFVLLSRGASDDVINTLKVNYDRGTLKVVPLFARFDMEGMNTLVDVAVVSGTDVVSSTKGDLISKLDYASLPRVHQITSFKGNTVVQEDRTARSVAIHVARLRDRRNDIIEDELGKLLDVRIRSLSPNHVVIRVVDDADFVINSQAIDRALRSVKSCIEKGLDDAGEPITTCIASKYHSMRCKETLSSIGAVLC